MRKLSLLLIAAGLFLSSCSTLDSALDCLCPPRFGNPVLDSFFNTAEQLQTAALRVDANVTSARQDLAVSLGLSATASTDEIRTAYCDMFDVVELSWDPPVCRSDITVAVNAAAECDVEVTPGEFDVHCQGRCYGTCEGTCNADCQVPSVYAYCDGECHGSCMVAVDGDCYGNCHGTCTGVCSVNDGTGACAGSCNGTCTGYCDVQIAAECTGECNGYCVIETTGGCNAQCEGTCNGHCEGHCDGVITAPDVDADCEAEIQARAAGNVECLPPQIYFDADPGAVADIAAVTHNMARVIAATAEVETVATSLASFGTDFGSVAGAVVDGDGFDAGQAACAATKIDDVTQALDDVRATLNTVVDVNTMFVCI